MHDQQVSTPRKQINLTLLIDRWVSDTRLGDVWVGGRRGGGGGCYGKSIYLV